MPQKEQTSATRVLTETLEPPSSRFEDTHSSDLSTSADFDSVGDGLFRLDVCRLASVTHEHGRNIVHGHRRSQRLDQRHHFWSC